MNIVVKLRSCNSPNNWVLIMISTMLEEASPRICANHMSSILNRAKAFHRVLMHQMNSGPRTPVIGTFDIVNSANMDSIASRSYTGHTGSASLDFVAII